MSKTGSMEQFHTFSTYTYRNFSERMISDLEQIICNFSQLPRYQALREFYTKLQDHLNNQPKAHNFDIHPFSQQLVQQMYQAYLNSGYTGTISDMLMGLIKNVNIATAKDSSAGFSSTKAETVDGFDTRLDKHNKLRKAHMNLYNEFVRQGVPGLEPYFYYSAELHNFPAGVNEECAIPGWNIKAGSLFLCFDYLDTEEDVPLLEFKNAHASLSFVLRYISGVTRLVIHHGTVSKTITLPFPGGGYDKLVFSYNPEVILIRDLLTTIQYVNSLGDFLPTSIVLGTEMGTGRSSLREFSYYPVDMDKSEMLFYLND